jgi:hypothetical protein
VQYLLSVPAGSAADAWRCFSAACDWRAIATNPSGRNDNCYVTQTCHYFLLSLQTSMKGMHNNPLCRHASTPRLRALLWPPSCAE